MKPDPFFESATFCFLKSDQDGSCIPDVRRQGGKDTCLAFSLTAAIYADSVINQASGNPLVGSRQELIDCLHIFGRPNSQNLGKVMVTSRGVPNSFPNGLDYIKHIGISLESNYEFKGSPHVCKERLLEKLSGGHTIDRKIFIGDYRKTAVLYDRNLTAIQRHENVIQQLKKRPVVGAFLLNYAFKNLDHIETPIYMGASDSEKGEYQEMKRNRMSARQEAEKKKFFDARKQELARTRHEAHLGKKTARLEHEEDEVVMLEELDKQEEENEEAIKEVIEEPPTTGYHAVMIIGYGEMHGVGYFVCQNSYGDEWGHRGYFRIAMDAMGRFHYLVDSECRNIDKEIIHSMRKKIATVKAKQEQIELEVRKKWLAELEGEHS